MRNVGKRRTVGLLGQPVYDSDDDKEWTPSTRYEPKCTTMSPQKQSGASAQGAQPAKSPGKSRKVGRRRQDDEDATHAAVQAQDAFPSSRQQQRKQQEQQQQQHQQPFGGPHQSHNTNHAAVQNAPAVGGGIAARVAGPNARAARGPQAARPCDWGGLTASVLERVLWWACAASALPTAGAAPCVCRHWREVCWGLQQPQQWVNVPTDAAEKAVSDAWAAARAAGRALLPAAAAGSAALAEAAVASGSSVVAYDGGDGYGTIGSPVRLPEGLWGCLDVRCRPSTRLNDTVIARGLASGCWSQVHTLRLRNCEGFTVHGLVALCSGCPKLAVLQLSECDSLVKLDAMRLALSHLPLLRHLDLSNCQVSNVDKVIKLALAPRPLPQALLQQVKPLPSEVVDAGGAASMMFALPCPLRVFRASGCPRLGSGTLRALAPNEPHVIVPCLPRWQLPPGAATTSVQEHTAVDGHGAQINDADTTAKQIAVPLFVHLTELDLTRSGVFGNGCVLAVEKLQAAAPNLRILLLDATGDVDSGGIRLGWEPKIPGPGFPQLRLCEMGLSRTNHTAGRIHGQRQRLGASLEPLRRVVGGSPRLHTLDVSGDLSEVDKILLRNMHKQSHASAATPDLNWERAGNEDAAAMVAAVEAEAVAVDEVGTGAMPRGAEALELRSRLSQTLGTALRQALPGAVRVLRASRSLLASDAGLHALSVGWGATLEVLDVSESTHVTDAGLLHLARRCTTLTTLDIACTAVTDFGLKVLLGRLYSPRPSRDDERGAEEREGEGATPTGGSSQRASASIVMIDSIPDKRNSSEDGNEQVVNVGLGACGGSRVNAGDDGRTLRHLDITRCRSVSLATRHASAKGLQLLWRALGYGKGDGLG